MQRINLGKTAPELYKTVIELENLSMQKVQQAGLDIGFSHLLKLRASQINQCAFCVRMHTQDAVKAALILIEEITLLAQHHFPDQAYEQAAQHLSSAEITAIEWIGIVINTWNRIAISSQYRVAPE
ncbi:hypothetical protein FQR65_LT16902 [Abscondita terminalis]|nr:hypothetical protein FQR65_LT16902 [Abscondita terminalis]